MYLIIISVYEYVFYILLSDIFALYLLDINILMCICYGYVGCQTESFLQVWEYVRGSRGSNDVDWE